MSLTDDYIDNREFGRPIHRYPVPASEADDQLPVFAKVGRGIRGDGYKVKLIENTADTVKLAGYIIDGATGQESPTAEWTSKNISGGQLMYSYNLRPYTDPQTFTITFRLKRPGQPEWQWTTPAIPYIWDGGQDGNIGSGVATLFIKPKTGGSWTEKLVYPNGTTRTDYNAPAQGQPWTVNLTYGSGGDIDVPTMTEMAKLLGVTVNNLRNIINGQTGQFASSDNVKDYVDDKAAAAANAALSHLHSDLGFSSGYLAGDGGTGATNTVKKYIDSLISSIESRVKLLAHPIGSTYIQVLNGNSYKPETLFGGTWSIISSERYLKASATVSTAGTTNIDDGIPDSEIDSYLDSNNVPLVSHEHLMGITTNSRAWKQEVWGQDTDHDGIGYLGHDAGLANPDQAYGTRAMVSIYSDPNNNVGEPPNGAHADATLTPGNPYYNEGHPDQPYIARTGRPLPSASTRRPRINTPKYINVVIWKRTA